MADNPYVSPSPAIIAKRLADDPKLTQASLSSLYQGIYKKRCHDAAVEVCGPVAYTLSAQLCTLLIAVVKHADQADAAFEKFLAMFGACAIETASPGTMANLWATATPGAEPSLADLAAAGHPGGYASPGGLCADMRAIHRERWLCDPSRYLFSEKEPVGYHAVSETGEWDTKPTPTEVFKAKKEFRIWVPASGKQKGHWAPSAWVDEIRSFSRRTYDYKSKEPLVLVDGIQCKNDYVASRLEPVSGDWSLYRELLMNLVDGDGAGFEFVVDWAARQLQELRKGKPFKMGTILVFYGAHRAGKGLFAEAMKLMYGANNTAEMNQTQMDGRFSGQLRGKLLVVLNEVTSNTNRGPEVGNKLKNWATDPTVPIEAKGVEAGSEPNNFNLLFLSNFERPVYLEEGDGRYTFFEQTKRLNRALGKTIHEDQVGNQQQTKAFFAELLQRQTQVGFGDIYENVARSTQVLEAEDSLMKFTREVASDGWVVVARHWVEAERVEYMGTKRRKAFAVPTPPHAANFVESSIIVEVYDDWCRRNLTRAVGSPATKLGKVVEKLGLTSTSGKYQGVRGWFDFGQVRPPLQLVPPPAAFKQGLHCVSMEVEDVGPSQWDNYVPTDWELSEEWRLSDPAALDDSHVPDDWQTEFDDARAPADRDLAS